MKPTNPIPPTVLAALALVTALPAQGPRPNRQQNQQPPSTQPPPAPQPPPPPTPTGFTLPPENRSVDGSANNAANPAWGQAGGAFLRQTRSFYEDGAQTPAGANRPSARAISNAVVAQTGSILNSVGATDMLWQWGQFVDHDLDLTGTAMPIESFPIVVPTGDPQFDPLSTGAQVIPLSRSVYQVISGAREQTNALSAYIDASQVYGSDAARAAALRRLDGSGKLKTTASANGDLLPYNVGGLPNAPAGPTFFLAGDLRVNEQVGLIALHTLFVREHNWWTERYKSSNPTASEEETYQFARLMIGAEMQAITYREFLPVLLGANALPAYSGYRSAVNAGVSNEFATAAFRLGHSLLSPTIRRLDASGRSIPEGDLNLANAFFTLAPVENLGIDAIVRGLAGQPAQELDGMIVDAVRNFLFGAPGSGGFDLASLNIQRGRDHGLPSFNQARRAFGMVPARNFAEINANPSVWRRLAAVYPTPDHVDLWVGGLNETDAPGAMVGPVFRRILVDQFTRSRDGDRFWYQRNLPPELIRMVEEQTLARVIRRNTNIRAELQDNVFLGRLNTR